MTPRTLMTLSAVVGLLWASQAYSRDRAYAGDRAYVGDVDSQGNLWVYGNQGKGTVILDAYPRRDQGGETVTTTDDPDGGFTIRFRSRGDD